MKIRRRKYRWRVIHASGLSLTGESPRRRVLQRAWWTCTVIDPEWLCIHLWTGDYWYEVDAERDDDHHWLTHLEEKVWWDRRVHPLEFSDAWRLLRTWMALLGAFPHFSVEVVSQPWHPPARRRRGRGSPPPALVPAVGPPPTP